MDLGVVRNVYGASHRITHPSIHPSTHPPTDSSIHPSIHPSIHSPIHPPTHPHPHAREDRQTDLEHDRGGAKAGQDADGQGSQFPQDHEGVEEAVVELDGDEGEGLAVDGVGPKGVDEREEVEEDGVVAARVLWGEGGCVVSVCGECAVG